MPIHALCSLLTLGLSKGLAEGRIQNFCVISGFKTSVSIRQIRVRLKSVFLSNSLAKLREKFIVFAKLKNFRNFAHVILALNVWHY